MRLVEIYIGNRVKMTVKSSLRVSIMGIRVKMEVKSSLRNIQGIGLR